VPRPGWLEEGFEDLLQGELYLPLRSKATGTYRSMEEAASAARAPKLWGAMPSLNALRAMKPMPMRPAVAKQNKRSCRWARRRFRRA